MLCRDVKRGSTRKTVYHMTKERPKTNTLAMKSSGFPPRCDLEQAPVNWTRGGLVGTREVTGSELASRPDSWPTCVGWLPSHPQSGTLHWVVSGLQVVVFHGDD